MFCVIAAGNIRIRIMFGIVLIAASLCLGRSALAENRCTCPKVPALGVGDSSCSASESDGRCAVDFNLFGPEREQRAVDLLKPVLGRFEAPSSDMSSVDAIMRSSPDQIVDFVLVYLVVGLA